jgi:hypothetical protein
VDVVGEAELLLFYRADGDEDGGVSHVCAYAMVGGCGGLVVELDGWRSKVASLLCDVCKLFLCEALDMKRGDGRSREKRVRIKGRMRLTFSQFFPLVMNAFQYYVIDSFIKARDVAGFTQLSGDSSPNSSRRGSFDSLHSTDSDLEHRSHRPQDNRRRSSHSSGLLTPNGSRSKSVEPKLSTDGLTGRGSGAGTPTSFTTRMPLRPTKSSNNAPQLGQNARDQLFGQVFDDDDEGMAAWGVDGHSR